MQLENRKIIVTGGARGMGAATVRAYVAEGAQVVSLDLLEDEGRAVVEAANAAGPGSATFLACDVSSRASVDAAFAEAARLLGGLQVLAHAAGIERLDSPEDCDDAHWDLMMAVNGKGTMYTNQAAFRLMKDSGGQIINFGSAAGVKGMTDAAAYSASKGAVLVWTRVCAAAWGRYNISVNAMAPAIWTPMYDAHRASMSNSQLAFHDEMMRLHLPLGGKLGDPVTQFAPVMVFMASEGARFITGQTLPVDGGALMLT